MHLLQLLFRASPAILLLVFCLQFRTNKAEEDTFPYLSLPLQLPRLTQGPLFPPPPPQIQCSLLSRNPMEGPFNYVYTACLCDSNPRTFYWDFEVNSKYRGHSREERSTRVGENIKKNVTPVVEQSVGAEG
nr:prolactin-inducible protein [Vulpes vulpes]